jgi:hypothetical protein
LASRKAHTFPSNEPITTVPSDSTAGEGVKEWMELGFPMPTFHFIVPVEAWMA